LLNNEETICLLILRQININTNIMYYIIKLNGIYDILCSFAILKWMNIPLLNELHLSMFKKEQDEVSKRMLAYWIFTYGIIRLSDDKQLILLSYLLESVFLLNEYNKGSMKKINVYFCALSCLFIMFFIDF
jgi:hypothetical protein